MDVVSFQKKWIGASNLKEKSASQSHFNDLCDLLDVPKPTDIDHTGEHYTFERGASITAGGNGWADVWMKGHFAWEYKGQGKNLDAAYMQLLRYKDDLGNPPLLVVSDLNIIRIHTNFTNTAKEVHEFDLNGLNEPGVIPKLRLLWNDPLALKPRIRTDELTAKAAAVFADVTKGLYDRGQHPETTAHFLVQVVFSLFAEDIGLLPDRIFSEVAGADRTSPQQFQDDVSRLFTAMQGGGRVFLKTIPHVNGGLFKDVDVPLLQSAEIEAIYTATGLDWSQIEPAIFGTLFERALDPTKRSQLGAHYTGMEDIERVVQPVVMAPLLREWTEIQEAITSGKISSKKPRGKSRSAAEQRIEEFLEQVRSVTVLDPACGSGNFLYVALKALLTLEKEVMTWRAVNLGTSLGLPEVHPRQIKGIEINVHAQQLAQAAIWIGHLQWMNDNGFGWIEPILDPLDSIENKDALLTFHDDGTVTETEWPAATYIIGNPPFLGAKFLRAQLGDGYVTQLHEVFKGRIAGFTDLVGYFFEKARQAIAVGNAERAGLLATNSMRGGSNRQVLQKLKETGDIYLAWDDEPWILDGAAVRIAIVGFDDGTETDRTLDGRKVTSISSFLTEEVGLTNAVRLRENSGIGYLGSQLSGPFDVDRPTAESFLAAPLNPNSRPNSDVVRPMINAMDITRRSRDVWVVDFGVSETEENAALYELPFGHVEDNVKPMRAKSRSQLRDNRWWLHLWPRGEMRRNVESLGRYIATPAVSKYRLYRWYEPSVLANHAVVVFAREDDYFFGVLHSSAHELWSLRMGTWLGKGNDPRYTPTTTFETYPLPWPPGQEPVDDSIVQRIAAAAKELDDKRNAWLNPEGASEAELKKRTLTNLYNANPTWLRNLHAALDRAVWDAYGWPVNEVPAEVDEDVILSRLLALNLDRAARS